MKSSNSKANPPEDKIRRVVGLIVSIVILVVWIWLLDWAFSKYIEESYLNWFVSNGAKISLVTAFLAIVWVDLNDREGLLSFHPGEFMAACIALTAIFFYAMAAHLEEPRTGGDEDDEDPVDTIERHWDYWLRRVLLMLMGVAVIGWVILVAPLFYLLTLVTGAPGRRELSGTCRRFVVNPNATRLEENKTYRYLSPDQTVPEGFVVVSFGERPFALTNALNAAVLFLVGTFLI